MSKSSFLSGFGFSLVLTVLSAPAFASLDGFTLPIMNDPDNQEEFAFSEHQDKIFVFHAFLAQCAPNYLLAPTFNELADAYQDDPRIVVIDLGGDHRKSDYFKWVDKTEPNHLVLRDVGREMLGYFDIRRFPTTVVTDTTGQVHYRQLGILSKPEVKRMKALIDGLLDDADSVAE